MSSPRGLLIVMAGRILVIVQGPHREKVTHCLRWTAKLWEKSLVDDVKVCFFGSAEKLIADRDGEVLDLIRKLRASASGSWRATV